METVVIEAVSSKFANKYNSGSVKANGKWMQVASKLPISLFKQDTQMSVETKTNDKGYVSIIGVGQTETPTETAAEKPKRKKVEDLRTKTIAELRAEDPNYKSYEDNKNRRIQVQGLLQGVIQSPATINFGDDVSTIASKVLELTDLLIAGMDERV